MSDSGHWQSPGTRSPFDRLHHTRFDGSEIWESDLEGGPARIAKQEAAAARTAAQEAKAGAEQRTRHDRTLDALAQALTDRFDGQRQSLDAAFADLERRLETRLAELGGRAMGLHQPGESYRRLDRVSFNGSEWIAKRADPGPLPGDGWVMSVQAKRGKPGPAGDRGPPGIGLKDISAEDSVLVFQLSDGTTQRIDIAPLVEKVLAGRTP